MLYRGVDRVVPGSRPPPGDPGGRGPRPPDHPDERARPRAGTRSIVRSYRRPPEPAGREPATAVTPRGVSEKVPHRPTALRGGPGGGGRGRRAAARAHARRRCIMAIRCRNVRPRPTPNGTILNGRGRASLEHIYREHYDTAAQGSGLSSRQCSSLPYAKP